MAVKIDDGECVGCGICVDECPEKAIILGENNLAIVDESLCTDCGICIEACPNIAISLG